MRVLITMCLIHEQSHPIEVVLSIRFAASTGGALKRHKDRKEPTSYPQHGVTIVV